MNIPSQTKNLKSINNSKISYRLKQVDYNGEFKYSNIVEVDFSPVEYALYQNYPNPFNPNTKITWRSQVSGWQILKIYDLLGNEIATLVDEFRPAGNYEIEFNSESNAQQLASGVYFYCLRAGDFIETKKMNFIK